MENRDFCVFILSHGRPHNVITYDTLIKLGYTGPIRIIVANDEEAIEQYKGIFGNKLIIFDKSAIAKTIDAGDTSNDRRTVIYARNACHQIAKDLGFTYYLQLDDDYPTFVLKFDENLVYKEQEITSLDPIFDAMLEFYKKTNCLSIALAQNGDFLGGKNSGFAKNLTPKRKAMNTFFCSTDRPFSFVGRINEDTNTYTSLSAKGHIFLTVPNIAIHQAKTQSQSGGMTEVYLDKGTYIKSFYSVMYHPSGVKISTMGQTYRRIHHKVNWNHTAPKILKSSYRPSK